MGVPLYLRGTLFYFKSSHTQEIFLMIFVVRKDETSKDIAHEMFYGIIFFRPHPAHFSIETFSPFGWVKVRVELCARVFTGVATFFKI